MPNETYDWDGVRERLRQDADRGYPPAWQPDEPDEEIFGVVVAVRPMAPTVFGPAPIVELEDPTGTRWSIWLVHTVLRRAFERQRVALGETVLIRYLGKHHPETGGNAYDNYTLVVDRPAPTGQPDWDGISKRYQDGTLDEEIDPPAAHSARAPAPEPDAADDDIPF